MTPEQKLQEAAEKYPKGGVEESAFFAILNSMSEALHEWDKIPYYVAGAKFGANWQSTQQAEREAEIVQKVLEYVAEQMNTDGSQFILAMKDEILELLKKEGKS